MQIGHSYLSGGSLKSSSSNNSAARFLHAFLCCERCTIWQSRLQYFTILQAVHLLSLASSDSALLQLAHAVSVSAGPIVDDDMVNVRVWLAAIRQFAVAFTSQCIDVSHHFFALKQHISRLFFTSGNRTKTSYQP